MGNIVDISYQKYVLTIHENWKNKIEIVCREENWDHKMYEKDQYHSNNRIHQG